MRFEIKKLFSNRLIPVLGLLLIFVNGLLVYQRLSEKPFGYSISQVKAKFSQATELEEALEKLETLAFTQPAEYDPKSLLTEGIDSELALLQEAAAQQTRLEGYQSFLRSIISDSSSRMRAGILGTENDYAYRAQSEAVKKYQRLLGLQLPSIYLKEIETLTSWFGTDLILFAFILSGSFLLFTEEQASGMLLLLRPTKGGTGFLFFRKLAALYGFVTVVFAALYGSSFLICLLMFGSSSFSCPIQTVPGFLACSEPLTVIGFLIFFFVDKLLAAWTVASIVSFLCVTVNTAGKAFALCCGAVLICVGLLQINSPWALMLNPIKLFDVCIRYQSCEMLPLFGIPLPTTLAFYVVCLAEFGLFTVLNGICFTQKSLMPSDFKIQFSSFFWRNTTIVQHEARKIYVSQRAFLWVILFLLVQCGFYCSSPQALSFYEANFKAYSDILSGKPTAEKDRYLEEENDRMILLQDQIASYNAIGLDAVETNYLTENMRLAFRAYPAFQAAKAIYDGLRPGQDYVYPSGYQAMYGKNGIREALRNLLLLQVFLILSLAGINSRERETGVDRLQLAYCDPKRIVRAKQLIALLCACSASLIAWIPQIVLVLKRCGLPLRRASANSLRLFSGLPNWIKLWQILVLSGSLKLFLPLFSVCVIPIISRKSNTTGRAILTSALVLLLPTLCCYLLI